ncbi:MBOAT family O-acyltransferase [Bacillus infantis]|uniref:MBOAT family O-acyltransferase n=1 Tax=Bacillus infantis TaxID=324767 RepID=UPI003019B30D
MLFNSYEFIFYFLPIAFLGYFFLHYMKQGTAAKLWIVAASLFFYAWWNISYLPLILISMLVNFAIGTCLGGMEEIKKRKIVLTLGIVFNAGLLGYFKYTDFFLSSLNTFAGDAFPLLHLALPLAISFFTFQQIAYLVDSYRYETKGYKLHEYMVFVSFFPQLIAGPIVHHSEMMSEFHKEGSGRLQAKNIALGLFIFGIGLFKKVMIADSFSVWANDGYSRIAELNFAESWIVSLSYTFQLYFDFSGYCDMAAGAALLFNIRLPINFNSPYKSLNIQDFWRRWHMTLGRFLTHYIYFPLGGNRKGPFRTYINIMIIFLVSGFWHGAGWTFIFWGFLHGAASVVYRWWSRKGFKMPAIIAWFITFNFVNMAWVFFRAESFAQAVLMLKIMFGFINFELPTRAAAVLEPLTGLNLMPDRAMFYTLPSIIMIILALFIVTLRHNSFEMMHRFKPSAFNMVFLAIISIVSILQLGKISEFLYFNF